MKINVCLIVIAAVIIVFSASIQISFAVEFLSADKLPFDPDQICDERYLVDKRPFESINTGHDFITGSNDDNDIVGGKGDGCYDGGDGADNINIVNQVDDNKYIIDDDTQPDDVMCNGNHANLVVEQLYYTPRNTIVHPGCPPYGILVRSP